MALQADGPVAPPDRADLRARLIRLVARPGFQSWAARIPILRRIARAEGDALFDLVQGFVASQVLYAVVSLDLLDRLSDGPATPSTLARGTDIPTDRMHRLCQAAAALRIMRRTGDRFALTTRGAALLGVPGLAAMIRHHDVLYRDLADPVAFLRGETETELAGFWPYVFGADGATDPEITRTYSRLMADSQRLVAEDTLRAVSLRRATHLLDIGGGSGVFAEAASRASPDLSVTLFDLPAVAQAARQRLGASPVADRIAVAEGSFRDDPLPRGADAVSLIRVLYDHEDATVRALLAKIRTVLPAGGRLIVSEPMSGGTRPAPAGDVYFAFYCMAMRTGTVRSQARIAEMLTEAGFAEVETPRPARPFVTSVVTARG
ncbi:methyltransferase [Citreimonas sp.]|uniref:methyltransferase n=1 Tax=Citreimonas sp. TaxID=3036715 RepID=UPI0035C83112